MQQFQLALPKEEFEGRQSRLITFLQHHACSGAVLFDNYYIYYFTGFAFIPTERPIGLAISNEGERVLFVPLLEGAHGEAHAVVDRVSTYPEYPGERHPMQYFVTLLREMGIKGKNDTIALDYDGYPWILGYQGPELTSLVQCNTISLRPELEKLMAVKSPCEVRLIQESVRWGNLAHTLLQRYTKVGLTETEVSDRACSEATRAMLDAIGPIYRSNSLFGDSGAGAGYRGQIGRGSSIPHALANNVTFQPGDVLVTGAGASVWGYNSELERTMILGPPSSEQKKFFQAMLDLQNTALDTIKPGIRCATVDEAVQSRIDAMGLRKFACHHSGHCIGIRYHEGPFLDTGDQTIIEQGMIFTVEPGLYVPDLGGFRHSDTVRVTDESIELMTYYPRDLDSLTLPI